MFDDSEFVTWANENVVLLVGHVKGSHKSVDVAKPAKGEPKTQCSMYPGLTCEEHEKIFAEATGKGGGGDAKDAKAKPKSKKDEPKAVLPRLEVSGFPTSYVIYPNGKFEKLGGDREPSSCRASLEEQQKKVEEHPIAEAKWPGVKAAWADAEKAFKASKWKATLEAIARTEAVVDGTLPKSYVDRVKEKVDAIDAKFVARLADAKKLKDPAAAAKAATALKAELDVKIAFGPLPVMAAIDEFLGLADATSAMKPADKPADGPDPAK